MKERKMVLSVILGIALVSLITALVAGTADFLSLLIDGGNIENINYKDYHYIVGGCEIALVVVGIAFVVLFCCMQNKYKVVYIVAAAVVVVYFVISAIVLKCSVPINKTLYIKPQPYTLFMSYIATAITITVSTVLTCVSALLLSRAKKKEEATAQEQASAPVTADKTENG